MIQRFIFLSQLIPQAGGDFKEAIETESASLKVWLEDQGVVTFTLFAQDLLLCIYMEATEPIYEYVWPKPFRDLLEIWPGQPQARNAVRMPDIFHDGQPVNVESWRASRVVERRIGSLARLKPEMFSSYIFYHYQMQEESPESFNKTYMIGTYDTYIFSYQEIPAVVSDKKPLGLLRTSETPADWPAVMLPHFHLWTDTSKEECIWRTMDLLFGY